MKNHIILKLSILILGISFATYPITTYATNTATDQETHLEVKNIKYDETKKALTGKTSPNTNIYIENFANYFISDSNGNFEVPVPDDLKELVLSFHDYENNQSAEIIYNIAEATSKTTDKKENDTNASTSPEQVPEETNESVDKTEESNTTNTSTTDSTTSTSETSQSSTSLESSSSSTTVPDEEDNNSKGWIWILLGMILLGGIGGFVYFKNKKKKSLEKKKRKQSNIDTRDEDAYFDDEDHDLPSQEQEGDLDNDDSSEVEHEDDLDDEEQDRTRTRRAKRHKKRK